MKVRVQIARSVREYATVIVEADSEEAAQAYVEELFGADDYSDACCWLLNRASWDTGDSRDDEEVIDTEPADEDDKIDAIVPQAAGERRMP